MSISQLYTDFMTLINQNFHNHSEEDEYLNKLLEYYLLRIIHNINPNVSIPNNLLTTDNGAIKSKITWNDNSNGKGVRPDGVDIIVYEDNTPKYYKTLNNSNSWEALFLLSEFGSDCSVELNEDIIDCYDIVSSNNNFTMNLKPLYNLTVNLTITGNPNDADMSSLMVQVYGGDPQFPVTRSLGNFTHNNNGSHSYTFNNLLETSYLIQILNFDGVIEGYRIDNGSIVVTGGYLDSNKNANLSLTYVEEEVVEEEFVDIPVTITWSDNNDSDGNRPSDVTIRLYADGVEVNSHVCSSVESWSYIFTEKPRYSENGDEITYSVNIDGMPSYSASINGYNITLNYYPEVTSKSVSIIWNDDNDAQKVRPSSVAVSLSVNGTQRQVETLSASNGWTSTVNNLPTVVNGMTATYTWIPQSVMRYNFSEQEINNVTVFTYTISQSGGGKPPKTPTTPIKDEYDEPL